MGKIFVVGLGPGNRDELTPRALAALESCDVILGYNRYIALIAPIFCDGKKELRTSSMRQEIARCREALGLALEGRTVGLVSSGDAGVYGMAGLMLEVAHRHNASGEINEVEIEVVPGITALLSAGAILGAPLMHDFVVISLSNLLTTWEKIERRLIAAADGDFVICLYNPASHGRPDNMRKACELLLAHGVNASRPVGWVRNAGRAGTTSRITTLEELKSATLDMFCTVIIGNSGTKILGSGSDIKMLTPRGYENKINLVQTNE